MNNLTPCDKIILPVYLTYRGDKGLRADKEMFREGHVICLRWYTEDMQMHQRIAVRPHAWRDGKNYYDPETRKWKYD